MRMRNLRNDRGSAFVELALVLPFLCLLLIGSVELGRIAYAAIEVSNAARAAVAYSSQNRFTAAPPKSGDPDYRIIAASADAADLASMGATLVTVPGQSCYCDKGSGAPDSVTCQTALSQCPTGVGTIVVYATATTTTTVPTIFNYPGLPNSFTLHGFAEMRVQD